MSPMLLYIMMKPKSISLLNLTYSLEKIQKNKVKNNMIQKLNL